MLEGVFDEVARRPGAIVAPDEFARVRDLGQMQRQRAVRSEHTEPVLLDFREAPRCPLVSKAATSAPAKYRCGRCVIRTGSSASLAGLAQPGPVPVRLLDTAQSGEQSVVLRASGNCRSSSRLIVCACCRSAPATA